MKKLHSKHLLALFFVNFLTSLLLAQQPERCATVEYNKLKEEKNPAIASARQRANHLIEQYVNEHHAESARSIITIPVVVHIIYNINLQNISDAQVQSQIDVLNRDYARLNADTIMTPSAFSSIAANPGIQFCLATRKPNGEPTNGIERRQNVNVTSWSNNDEMKSYAAGGLDAWDRNKYLNIWVCTLSGSYLGYTQLPGSPDSLNDGCVVTSRAFGDTLFVSPPFHLGRTATHEVGHWLGLYHPWGDDGGACPWNPGGNDDQISDTPPESSETVGCPTFPKYDACSPNYPGVMFMNYMDYTDDACMNMFTQEQSNKMHAVLNTIRSQILISEGCTPTGIDEIHGTYGITLYPNPVSDNLSIEISTVSSDKKYLSIYNMLGEVVLKKNFSLSKYSLNLSQITGGVYVVEVRDKENIMRKKLVKE